MGDTTIGSNVSQVQDIPKPVGIVDDTEVEQSSKDLETLSQTRPS